jgi:hypothetical protein
MGIPGSALYDSGEIFNSKGKARKKHLGICVTGNCRLYENKADDLPPGIKINFTKECIMSQSQNLECSVSVNLLLEVAQRLFSYEKVPLALALIHVVLEQHPENSQARKLYETFTGRPATGYTVGKKYHLDYDTGTGMFILLDKHGKGDVSFKTLEEADTYLRGLK